MAGGWSKKQRRELRELQGVAWQRELVEALRPLCDEFKAWENDEVSPFELSDRIHKFHNGRSRELFNWYSRSLDTSLISSAVARGIIEEAELPEDLRAELAEDIEFFRGRWQAVDRPLDSD